jgi:hypothetical protein
VRALLAHGDRPRAVSLGQAFVSAHADSPYAARIRAIVDIDDRRKSSAP